MPYNWQPYWQAAHAYTVGAVIIPTVFGGYTWRCTTGGTSGGSEPAWPADPSSSPTVNDNGVIWTVGTGFRQGVQAGVIGLVQAFSTANPTIVRAVFSVRPLNFAELPCFFMGDLNETITTTQGTRTRTMSGFSCFLVDQYGGDVEPSNDRMNFAADVFADLFTGGVHSVSGRSIFQHVATLDFKESDGTGVEYPALEFQFSQTFVVEGRT